MNHNDIFEIFQFGFCSLHSTKTALVKVTNNLVLTTGTEQHSILIVADISLAFDAVDHDVLTDHLKNQVGISDVALNWFISYLSDRSFLVMLEDASSSLASLFCGSLQGSILSSLLYSIYILSLGQIMPGYDINFHADDTSYIHR